MTKQSMSRKFDRQAKSYEKSATEIKHSNTEKNIFYVSRQGA